MGRNGRSKIVKTSRRLRVLAAYRGDSDSTRREDPRHLTERSGLDFRGLERELTQPRQGRSGRREHK